jgi:TetR/AcrR family transcriptional regulator
MPQVTRDADRTRGAVLDAAEALFAAQGYHPTSMAQIGERAGVSRGTPGYFFGSKESLYTAVLERCFSEARDRVREGLRRAANSGEPRETVLAGVVSDYFDYAWSHPDLVRLMHREALGEGPAATPVTFALEVGAEVVSSLANELGLSDSTARQFALALLALTWFPVIHRHTLVKGVGIDPDDRESLKLFATGLLRGALG